MLTACTTDLSIDRNACVKITICNADESNAFRPEKYGKAIIIERRFGRVPGVSKYICWSGDKRQVSDKKDEVDQICDHFAIQVDNPLSVLSQETAKKFLASAKPKDLYDVWMSNL